MMWSRTQSSSGATSRSSLLVASVTELSTSVTSAKSIVGIGPVLSRSAMERTHTPSRPRNRGPSARGPIMIFAMYNSPFLGLAGIS